MSLDIHRPLTALVGYQWSDSAAAELLHEELALRGFTVLHDRCTFTVGTRIDTAMVHAVEHCDAYVPLLTPHSLYEGIPAGSPRPALDGELIPVSQRRRASIARGEHPPVPVIAAVTHGLGDPRNEAPERVRRATGEDVASLWSLAVGQGDDSLQQADAGRIAAAALDALLIPGTGGTLPEITVASRGTGEPPAFLTIDATPLLGGADHRPGEPVAWMRYLRGVQQVERAVSRWTRDRALTVDVKTHLTGAIAFGRIFHLPAGWILSIPNRAGLTRLDPWATEGDVFDISAETFGRTGGPLVVDIDLIGHRIGALVNETIRELPPPSGRIQVARDGHGPDLSPETITATAARVAAEIRGSAARTRPSGIHLFVAAPATFGVALGQRLTALHTDLHLYERDGSRYVHALTIPAATA